MFLSKELSERIVIVSCHYLGKPFDWDTFNCVHFVRQVYFGVGINLPRLIKSLPPPFEFHLSPDEFTLMPIGHSVFFKRKETELLRPWTHMAIIINSEELIHCSLRMGNSVNIASKKKLLEVYDLAPRRPQED